MQVNNTIFEKKHHYLFILKEFEILKRQMEYEALNNEITKVRLEETYRAWNLVFIGLLREGLEYQYIKNATNPEKDIIRLTIDDIDYDCKVVILKNLLKDEFGAIIREAGQENRENNKKETKERKEKNVFKDKTKDVVTQIANPTIDAPAAIPIVVAPEKKEALKPEPQNNKQNSASKENNTEKQKDIKDITEQKEKNKKNENNEKKDVSQELIDAEELFTETEENIEEHEFMEERVMNIEDFIFDYSKVTVKMEGAGKGEVIDMMIAPIYINEKDMHPEIVVWAKHDNETVTGFSSKKRRSVDITIGDHSFIVRGLFKNGEFESRVFASGATLSMGFNLKVDTKTFRSKNKKDYQGGHVCYKIKKDEKDYQIHIFPLTTNNDRNGMAPCLILSENGEDKRLYDSEHEIIILESDLGKLKAFNYWDNNSLVAETLEIGD